MNDLYVLATSTVTAADLATARLGQRFGRMDRASQLSLAAVEPFAPQFDSFARDRVAIVLAARAGSLPTDLAYWDGRNAVGGLSPTLFTYTLPSAALGEIAIRHRLTGPNLCFVGDGRELLTEAAELLRANEADAGVVVFTHHVSAALSPWLGLPEESRAWAALLGRRGPGLAPLDSSQTLETLVAATPPR
jgi:3-oxoacyl-(acyl-carrier-protein) synthase